MGLAQTAFVERLRVPDRARLDQAISALGFDLHIDEFYQPFVCSGYLPCTLGGRKSGFEIYFEKSADVLKDFPHLEETIGSRDCAVTLRWGGNMTECACVLIVSAAFASDFGAVVLYQNDDIVYSVEQLLEETKVALASGDRTPQRVSRRQPSRTKRPWWKL